MIVLFCDIPTNICDCKFKFAVVLGEKFHKKLSLRQAIEILLERLLEVNMSQLPIFSGLAPLLSIQHEEALFF
jgi:hypothetical protein